MLSELVTTLSDDGVRLDGLLARSAVSGGNLPVDIFICHHGVCSNFYDVRMFDAPAAKLLDAGCDVLRVNNRGHDLVYSQPVGNSESLRRTRGRLGSAFETVDDCRHDWEAWIDFAFAAGYRRIGIWGHSLGAVKTVYFLATEHDERVRCAIASSPPRFCHQEMLDSTSGGVFSEAYARASALHAAGEDDGLLSVTVPTFNIFSANTYLDKYGPQDRYDFLSLLPRVKTPLFITLGGDERDVQYQALAASGEARMQQVPGGGFALIAGANHFYTGKAGELWAAAGAWLSSLSR